MTDALRNSLAAALAPAYTLTSELGGGGMSRVFVAREVRLERDVVVKVLSLDLLDGLSVERFTREIRLAAALQDPHIVPVLAAGTTAEGLPWYTMPYVRGASLRQRLNDGRVPHVESVHWLRDVSRALAYAHARGVVHRDIKPENILLSNGSALVTDFGLAKAIQVARTQENASAPVHGLTRTGMSLGTPAYMAPEQAAGDPGTDHRADLYAWGLVAYELLAGRHPFADKLSSQQLLAAQIVEVPRPLHEVAPDVSKLVAALVMQCLEKEPANRPGSAAELLRVLDDVQSQASATAPPAVAPKRRSATPLMLGVGAGLVVAVAAGLWWRASDRGSKPSTTAGPVMMAVLPFEHAGPADQQPFTDGLTDAVTAKLGALSSLMVIDRRSAATYRGTTKSTQQIGTELGVRYLLEGVVRWAKDGAGVWRARVTPTLVDAKSGAIKWTGEPATVTLDDPFTAQGSIATDVAQAMEVAILPNERVQLKRRFTDNAQAYASYQRGRSMWAAAVKSGDDLDPQVRERSARELEAAIALDSNFAAAWGYLAIQRTQQAIENPTNQSTLARARNLLTLAQIRAPEEPFVLFARATFIRLIDHKSKEAAELARRALATAPNDAEVLYFASLSMQYDRPDSARTLAIRAATLDPRSPSHLFFAAVVSSITRHWKDAERYSSLALQLDSLDQGAWGQLLFNAAMTGDTLALRQRGASVRRLIRQPGISTSGWMAYGGEELSEWFVERTAAQLRLKSLSDSIWYFDNKLDAALVMQQQHLARAYSDSLLTLVHNRELSSSSILSNDRLFVAYSYAATGNLTRARATLEPALATARETDGTQYPARYLDGRNVAAVLVALGETDEALSWIAASLTTQYTMGWYAIDPRMREFRSTDAWKRFVREHPQ